MEKLFYFIILLVVFTGCNKSAIDDSTNKTNELKSNDNFGGLDTILQNVDSIALSLNKDTIATYSIQSKRKNVSYNPPVRISDFPNDASFNGEPLLQQVNIPKIKIEKYPDTIHELALERYKSYINFFPKSIADNFDEMKSTTHIHYPKVLVFKFEIFENENAFKPYQIQEVKVRRKPEGEIYVEM